MFALRSCTRLAIAYRKLNVTNQISQRNIKRWVRPVLMELTKRKKKQEKPIDNPRSKYIEWNRDAEVFAFNNRLSEKFDLELLEQAFTFRSYIIAEEEAQKSVGIESPELDLVDNRDLIEEGREIVSLVIENYLNQSLPHAPKECVYALKNYLLSTEILAKVSSNIGTKDLILSTEYPVEKETLANTFYALTSALNRSVDLEHSGIFVRDILISLLAEKELAEIWCPDDAIDILNGILVREGRELAEPRIIAETGINTFLPVYQIGLYSNKEFLGSGIGETVEEGQHIAALQVILKMFGLLDSNKPIRCDLKIDDSSTNSLPLQEWKRSNV